MIDQTVEVKAKATAKSWTVLFNGLILAATIAVIVLTPVQDVIIPQVTEVAGKDFVPVSVLKVIAAVIAGANLILRWKSKLPLAMSLFKDQAALVEASKPGAPVTRTS